MSNAFNAQRKSLRLLALAAATQTDYGIPLTTSISHAQRFDGGSFVDLDQSRYSDHDWSGKGTQFTTEGMVTGWSTKLALKDLLDNWVAGWAFAFAMGADTITGPTMGAYTHAFSFDETTTEAPVTSMWLEDTEALQYVLPDMALSELTLTIPEKGPCALETSWVGSGRYGPTGALGTPPTWPPAAASYLLGSDCAVHIGIESFVGRFMGGSLKIATGVMPHVAPGGGLYAQFLRRGLWKYSMSMKLAVKQTDDLFTLFINDSPSTVLWSINSGAEQQLTVTVSEGHFKTQKLGAEQDMLVFNVELDETTTLGGATSLAVNAVNNVAAYLATGT
jgi:hypothetical protein